MAKKKHLSTLERCFRTYPHPKVFCFFTSLAYEEEISISRLVADTLAEKMKTFPPEKIEYYLRRYDIAIMDKKEKPTQ